MTCVRFKSDEISLTKMQNKMNQDNIAEKNKS